MQKLLTIVGFIVPLIAFNVAEGRDFYVRISGDNGHSGLSPREAIRNIERAVERARAGDTVFVGAGDYRGFEIRRKHGSRRKPIEIIADTTGRRTGDQGLISIVRDGIEVNGSSHVHVCGFHLRKSSGDGISIEDSNTIRITHTVIKDARKAGVRIRHSANVVIRNCVIHDSKDDGIHHDAAGRGSNRLSVNGTRILRSGERGIFIARGGSGRIWNCIVARSGDEAVCNEGGHFKMSHCTLVYNRRDGYEQEADARATIRFCIIAFNGDDGIDINGGQCKHEHNLLFQQRRDDYEGTDVGPGEISADPRLDEQFRPLPSSPAVDRARASLVPVDIDGLRRPQGKTADLGAVELPQKSNP